MAEASPGLDERVLIFAAQGEDARLSQKILASYGFEALPCGSVRELCDRAREGVGAILLADEGLNGQARQELLRLLGNQPSWSDLPLIVMAREGLSIGELLKAFGELSTVTILERPVQIATLVSSVQVAVRSRRRQYEVRRLLERLREEGRKKDDFIAMLGHELRNPLAVVRTCVELLKRGAEGAPSADRHLARIDHQAETLTRMVDDLLDLSRITRGKIELRREALDLGRLVARVVEANQEAAQRNRQALTGHASGAIWVEGDPVRLEQLLGNLVQNALKYTPEGGSIRVSAAGEGNRAVARVHDNGIGIDPDQIPKIFDSFAQLDGSLSRSDGGLGLGLALVQQIAELHGGSVEAASAGAGQGSVFTVTLPKLAEEKIPSAGRAELPEAAPRGGGAPLRIVLVDDIADARESLGELLRLRGHDVELAEDGEAAVETITRVQPDVALIDIGLPGIDGYEVARRLRQGGSLNGTVLIALTGYGLEQHRRLAREAGFQRHLVKPVDPDRLFELLENLGGEP